VISYIIMYLTRFAIKINSIDRKSENGQKMPTLVNERGNNRKSIHIYFRSCIIIIKEFCQKLFALKIKK